MRSRAAWSVVGVLLIAAILVAVYLGRSAPSEPNAPRLLVNEVLYLPTPDRPAFVEIVNAGRADTNLDGVSLRDEKGASFTLPKGIALAAGTFVVVRYDGLTGLEGGVVHAPADAFAGGDRGSIWLATPGGTIDGVVWGTNRPRAVELCRGGRCGDPVPGSVVARIPGETTALTTVAWAPLDPAYATPGQENPRPPVAAFAVLPGTIYSGKPRFAWYSVPGAARYRIEVASDETFATSEHEMSVDVTPLDVLQQFSATGPELAPGRYFWRVQALASDGSAAAFSAPIRFSIRAKGAVARASRTFDIISAAYADRREDTDAPRGFDENAICPDIASDGVVCKELAVPVIKHQKDTRMLTLEAPNKEPPMGWDKPDTAGYPYCARAGVAMVNEYYRRKVGASGKLSQDRIGYEVYHRLIEDFPEYDLPVVGITNHHTDKSSLPLALGSSGNLHDSPYPYRAQVGACRKRNAGLRCGDTGPCPPCPPELEYAWGYQAVIDIKTEIDAGRPLIITGPGHLYLLVGYTAKDGELLSIITQDEGGRVETDLQQNEGEMADWVDGRNVITPLDGNEAVSLHLLLDAYWTNLTPVKLGSDEASIEIDSDRDGIVDFDEEERFATQPLDADSDHDGVNDKQEVHYSVWDRDHGYHKSVTRLRSTADYDEVRAAASAVSTAVLMALFKDSDDGGCDDGQEDANANGVRDSDETSNFVKEDDDCGPPPLGGHVQLAYDYTLATDCIARMTIDSRFTLHPVIAPGAPDLVTAFRANEMAYDIATTGCAGAPGGNPIYTYPEGFHRSGTMPLTEENLGHAAFFATLPEFGMQLPLPLFDPAANTLKGSYTGNGGGPWPAESFARFEALSIYSNPSNCTDPGSGMYARPDQLQFCTDPTPCAVSATAPLECLGEPQRYYVLPFNKSFRWSGDSTKHLISDVTVTIDICDGCGAR